MIPFKKWPFRFKFPVFVLGAQLAILAGLELFFSKSESHAVKMTFLVVAYPFLNSLLFSSAWLVVLYWIGWGLEGSFKSKKN